MIPVIHESVALHSLCEERAGDYSNYGGKGVRCVGARPLLIQGNIYHHMWFEEFLNYANVGHLDGFGGHFEVF
jgi:hypothetical protein